MPQAKAAAQRALELDESVAEAHNALGFYLHYFEFISSVPKGNIAALSNSIRIMPLLTSGSAVIISFIEKGSMKPSPLSGAPKNSIRFRRLSV